MPHSRRGSVSEIRIDALSDRLRSSFGSEGSVSGRAGPGLVSKKSDCNNSGELSGSAESSPATRGFRPRHARSHSAGAPSLIYSGACSVNSPPLSTLPTGNICPSGKILKTGMASKATKTDVLGSGTGNYGHGSIMRGGGAPKTAGAVGGGTDGSVAIAMNSRGLMIGGETMKRGMRSSDPEEMKRLGNEHYKKGNFHEALNLYEKAIAISPGNAAYHCNRAAALIGLKRFTEAVRECEEAIRLDPKYIRAHHRLGSLFLSCKQPNSSKGHSVGQVENARRHICLPGHQPDLIELQKLEAVEKHIGKCNDARKVGDWRITLREADAAIAAGADASPQLFACQAEALLKLHQLDDAHSVLSNIPKMEALAAYSNLKIFGMRTEAYLFFVQAQIELALGRFENAIGAIERAWQLDSKNIEVSDLFNNVRLVSRARNRGNDLFKSERFTEACAAYGEGLRYDPSNSVLYCNRAACWYKLGQWVNSVGDCNQALRIHPSYTKALLRRAASYMKLERWAEAARDYEILKRELPYDNEVAESLFHAQVALKKSRGEDIYNMKFGGEVEIVSGLDQFRAAISSPVQTDSPILGHVVHQIPINKFSHGKVDVEESPGIANAENVRIVPTFKIYKKSSRVKEMVCPSPEVLESSVRHYST
nr:TPR repeat-containing thioredoxin TTL1 [Ipomoea batatas]